MENKYKGLMLNTEGFLEWNMEVDYMPYHDYDSFRNAIYWSIENAPYEPVQTNRVEDAIATGNPDVWDWFIKILDDDRASLGERTLDFLAYLERPHTREWRRKLLKVAVTHDHHYIRDSGIQLLDHWDEDFDILREWLPNEPVDYMRKYIQDILDWAEKERSEND